MKLILASPRGFCAGVERAIQIVERSLQKYGAPVYVRHEIVHNRYVVEDLKRKGAVFIQEVEECPPDRPLIFSAHGVAKSVPQEATQRNISYIDATCPLVSKVHREVEHHHSQGALIFLIGHRGHPEVIGTMGQAPEGSVILVETVQDVENLPDPGERSLAYVTQTTLSVDETAEIIQALKKRFPQIQEPPRGDICYATTNRQRAVQQIAPKVQGMIVVGSPNSSNSQRLRETALKYGCFKAQLCLTPQEIEWRDFEEFEVLGLTAGASAPEILVEKMVEAFQEKFGNVLIETVSITEEDIIFHLPKALRGW